jgi:hypothetical protein
MGVLAEFAAGEQTHAHAAQIYRDPDELAEGVASYLCAGFEAGEPALVVAIHEHLGLIQQRLERLGWSAVRLENQGLLVVADAHSTLRSIVRGEGPSPIAFEAVVGTLLDQIHSRFPGKNVRVFGEMVNILCERGETDSAFALEDLWNDLGRRKRFSLLCGYRLNVFDRQTQLAQLPHVCRQHSHIAPSGDDKRFTSAVEHTLDETLGAARTGQVYALVGSQARNKKIPTAQLALMWISSNTPALAERILARAEARYHDIPGPSRGASASD